MKSYKISFIAVVACLWFASCTTKSKDPSASSSVALMISAAPSSGKVNIGGREAASGVTLSDVKVNLKEISFDFEHGDDHFKNDSTFEEDDDEHLKGPFIVDLLDAGAFVDQVIATIDLPNARYEKISFKLAPSTVAGDMFHKSILIKGDYSGIPFEFWSDSHSKFRAKFNDSTSFATSGSAVSLAINLELDKILSKLNGGVDLSQAKDSNQDGTITIDPINTDGNKEIHDQIVKLLLKRTHCEKRDK